MEPIDFQHFVSAGYFLIRAGNPGWEQLETDLLPKTLLSLSDCISERFNIVWGWTPGNKEAALQFGIPEARWDDFVAWCSREYVSEMDMWSMFYAPDAARRIAHRFLDDMTNLHVIGVGLPKELQEASWCEDAEGREIYGIEKRVEQSFPLVEGGQPIGFDVVSFSLGDFAHSWLCGYLHFEMTKRFGIRSGEYGLLQTEQDAKRINDWIVEEDVREHRVEPEPYDYYLLVEYPLVP